MSCAFFGCEPKEEVDARPSCEVCHSPRPGPGQDPHGIDEAHPWGDPLECVACHGGDDTSYDQLEAHVGPGTGPTYLRNLTSGELDEVDPAYVQFVNPGDLRVAHTACGAAGCHGEIVDTVRNSMMGHTAGEITVARYRAAMQDHEVPLYGAYATDDPEWIEELRDAAPFIDRFDPMPVDHPDTASVGELQDDYMARSCFRCHLSDFGENRFAGDYRSSGCTACHMLYDNDGGSESEDPAMDLGRIPRPVRHELTAAVTTEQCMHCHYRGGRIGPSYLGFRESAGAGYNPPNVDVLGEAIHGHDASYYITDEDNTNDTDETPPDVHAEAGMSCIDCHTTVEVHGDGHIYADTQNVVEVQCETCHGSIEEESTGLTRRGNQLEGLERGEDGIWTLTSRIGGRSWAVPQLVHSMTEGHARYSAFAAFTMGRNDSGFSHTDDLRCSTCHSSWAPSCYGCHITMDYSALSRSQTTGALSPGRPSGTREWVVTDDLVLMRDTEGRIAPSMPAERFSMSVVDANGDRIRDREVRRFHDELGFGQRTTEPHTVRRFSTWSLCERCHINSDGSNEELVRITLGLGSDRFIWTDGEGEEYRLDAIVTPDGTPLVTVGHGESRPLEQELIEWLLNTPVQ